MGWVVAIGVGTAVLIALGFLIHRVADQKAADREAIKRRDARERRSVCRICGATGWYEHDCVVEPGHSGRDTTFSFRPRSHMGVFRDGARIVWMCSHLPHDRTWKAVACAKRRLWTLQYGKAPWVQAELPALRRRAERRLARGHVMRPETRLPKIELLNWGLMLSVYGNRCFYCGAGGELVREHLIPLARGGNHHASNIVPACDSCNRRKGTMTSLEYLERLGRRTPAAVEYLTSRHSEARLAVEAAEQVRATGEAETLPPMGSPQRMVVHLCVRGLPGVRSESYGGGAKRRIRIIPDP